MIDMPLYMNWPFTLAAFSNFSLFCVVSFLALQLTCHIIMTRRISFLFLLFAVLYSLVKNQHPCLQVWEIFLYNFIKNIFKPWTWTSPSPIFLMYIFDLFMVFLIPPCSVHIAFVFCFFSLTFTECSDYSSFSSSCGILSSMIHSAIVIFDGKLLFILLGLLFPASFQFGFFFLQFFSLLNSAFLSYISYFINLFLFS